MGRMRNHPPFSHPDLVLARSALSDLRNFTHPDLENDAHAQRVMCRIIDALRAELKLPAKPATKAQPLEMDWDNVDD